MQYSHSNQGSINFIHHLNGNSGPCQREAYPKYINIIYILLIQLTYNIYKQIIYIYCSSIPLGSALLLRPCLEQGNSEKVLGYTPACFLCLLHSPSNYKVKFVTKKYTFKISENEKKYLDTKCFPILSFHLISKYCSMIGQSKKHSKFWSHFLLLKRNIRQTKSIKPEYYKLKMFW